MILFPLECILLVPREIEGPVVVAVPLPEEGVHPVHAGRGGAVVAAAVLRPANTENMYFRILCLVTSCGCVYIFGKNPRC